MVMRFRPVSAGIMVATILAIAVRGEAAGVKEPAAVKEPETAKQPAARKQQVDKLVAELSSESRQVRVRAERALLKIGPAVLPFLPPPELTPVLSAREAVRRIRLQLERKKATESVLPSRVSLTGMHTVQEALKSIAEQSGNGIDDSQLPAELLQKPLACDYRDATFWSAIDDLAERIPATIDFSRNRVRLRAVDTKTTARRMFADNSTAFRVAVVAVTTRPLVGSAEKRLLRVSWTVSAEPRLRPLFLKYSGKGMQVVADGQTLTAFDPDARYELPLGDAGHGLSMHNDFLISARKLPKSVRVRGAVRLHTAAGSEAITFRRLVGAEGTAIRRGGVTVTLRKVGFERGEKAGRRNIKVRVAVGYDTGGPAFESHRTWIFHNRVYMTAKNDKPIAHTGGFKTTLQDDGAVGVEYNFDVPDEPPSAFRFVYVAPTLLIEVPIAFDIQKIPITLKQKAKRSP